MSNLFSTLALDSSLVKDFFETGLDFSQTRSHSIGYEKDGSYIYEDDVPGVPMENIGVTIENNKLIVTAKTASRNYFFEHSLPRNARLDDISASLNNGILMVQIPLITPTKKRIEIKTVPIQSLHE